MASLGAPVTILSSLVTLCMFISLVSSLKMELLRRDSVFPSNTNATELEKSMEILKRSNARARWIQAMTKKASRTMDVAEDEVDFPVSPMVSSGEYVMELKLGTPPQTFHAIADTGSDLTWLQCEGCQNCNPQMTLFSPSQSSSYVPCSTATGCTFTIRYGGKTITTGDLATETLTLPAETLENFTFGCSIRVSDNTKGIVGLGKGGSYPSLTSQLIPSFGNKFEYCLTSRTSSKSSTLSFGDVKVSSPNAVSDILFRNSPTFYYVDVQGISVGEQELQVDSLSTSGGVILDSGTTLTYLADSVYEALKAAILQSVAVKPYQSLDKSLQLDLCFSPSSFDTASLPTITFRYSSGQTELPVENILFPVENDVTCLAFKGTSELGLQGSIIGNIQQQNFKVLYDLDANTISFEKTVC